MNPATGACDRCLSEPARLDTDGTAKPKTMLVGHYRAGDCVGPGSESVDGYELRDAHEAAACQACAHGCCEHPEARNAPLFPEWNEWYAFEYIALEEMLQSSLDTMTPG